MAAAWLMMAAGADRQHAGNEGYDDDPARHYSWDNTVANRDRPQTGDFIVLWDRHVLLGASVIQGISERETTKTRFRCPECGSTGFKPRKNLRLRFRCYRRSCLREFDKPHQEVIPVHTYRSEHEAAWVDLQGCIDGPALRGACVEPKSIQSIRELDWSRFRDLLGEAKYMVPAKLIESAQARMADGHGTATVRVRKGQAVFRDQLRKRFGDVCAVTGPQPSHALEAAHLYSYAEAGVHKEHGGLLLRRDVHRLFDLGFLAVTSDQKVDVHPDVRAYPAYSGLHLTRLAVPVSAKTKQWLREHWAQHREPGPTT